MQRRNAFTIIELLVAMALVMFIMAVLSTAFATATQTFRNLKAIGDMANKLRTVTTLLQRDLAADHFEGKKRLSDPNFWLSGPPAQGYFRIWHESQPTTVAGSPCYIEGTALDGIFSYRSVNHMLAFTVRLRGNQMSDFLTAGVHGGGVVLGSIANFGPTEARYQIPNTYNFQWADVAWFLQPQVDPNTGYTDLAGTDPATGFPVPLYTLYRCQRLAVPDNNLVPPQPAGSLTSFLETSCWVNGTNLYFNSPTDLTVPARRIGMNNTNPAGVFVTGSAYPTLAQLGATGNLLNADVQATDVISFDVRVLVPGVVRTLNPIDIDPFVSLYEVANAGYNNNNPTFYHPTTRPYGLMVFDTWSSLSEGLATTDYSQWNVPNSVTSIPMWNPIAQTGPIIQAIQITIRVWDVKTRQTREVSIVQAM